MQMLPRLDRLTTPVLGLAVAIGLVGVFIGLSTNSFWYDELYTAWVIGDGDSLTNTIDRLLQDVHPPLFYLSLWGWAQFAGVSDTALRSFAAACGIAAMALFFLTTRTAFGLQARLFAMAVALNSSFWLVQSQNARSYTLTMVFVTAMLGLGLAIARHARLGRPIAARLALLAVVTGIGSFIHFYVMITALALLGVLFFIVPGIRWLVVAWGAVLAGSAMLYIQRVIVPHTTWLLDNSWIGNSPHWYLTEFSHAATATLNSWAVLPLVICLGLAGLALWRRHPAACTGDRRDQLALCVGVPLLVIMGGLLNSVLLRPSFTASNILVASPFIWGAVALAYDIGVGSIAGRRLGTWVVLGIAIATLASATRLSQRFRAHNAPFRESAAWIAAQPGCRGAAVPVLFNRSNPMKPGAYAPLAMGLYGHYLPPTMPPMPFEAKIGSPVATPPACPVIGWAANYVGDAAQAKAVAQMLAAQRGAPVGVRTFTVPASEEKAFVFVKVR